MRLKQAGFILFLVFPILACGLSPVQQLKEAAAEKVVEKAAERTHGTAPPPIWRARLSDEG